jgi:RNA polymerase sigma-70 factor (ECF subfamily)
MLSGTTYGGSKEEFPETDWSSIDASANPGSAERIERLNRLLFSYMRPVYTYIRLSWKKNIEDSKDLAQEFFAHLLRGDLLGKYVRERGRFRTFLQAALRNFLLGHRRDERRLKRGGGVAAIPIGGEMFPAEELLPAEGTVNPEEAFDREWGRTLMDRSIEEVRQELAREGKGVYFVILETYDLQREDLGRPTYQQMADTLGLTLCDVRNRLAYARARLRSRIEERVREYVSSPRELSEELRDLSRVLQAGR